MKKKLGLIIENGKKGDDNYRTKNLFNEKLGGNYIIDSFSWRDVSNNNASKVWNPERKLLYNVNLNSYDAIYLNGLGSIKGKEKDLLKFINNLGNLEGLVMNNPTTMSENFDKRYLLYLQSKNVSVIPTIDASKMNYNEINKTRMNGHLNALIKPRIFGERARGIIKLNENPFTKESFEKYKKDFGNELLIQPFIEDIIKYGEKSLIFVGDNFSHAIYRHRNEWNDNTTGITSPEVEATKQELKIAEDVLSVWPSKYHISRFDFITDNGKPMISEVEMINPEMWIGTEKDSVDNKFMKLFKNYLGSHL